MNINSEIQKHTRFHSGYATYNDNFGLWQGSLSTGTQNHTSGVS